MTIPENSMTPPDDDADRDQQLEAVIADYIRACESGTSPNRREILERHPELADELRQFFGQRDRMNQMAEPIRGFGDALAQAVGPGRQLNYVGNYELLEEIARGGMGVVYKARQTTLGRIVAVKMIVSGRLATEQDVQRFHVEAEAAAGLQHPNIVSIHEVGQHEGFHYFSMDYVEGRDLSAILRENLLPAKQAATYVRQMAEAIHYAHQRGTLHRDLKPSNILIDSHDQVRITDFGLAMRVEGDSDLTRTGQIVGTPSYMPPEQAQGQRSLIGPGSDVYSLGAILYECLTGRAPFRADSVMKTIEQVIHVEAASPCLLNPGIVRDLETICLKCLQKEPHRRYGTAQLLADDLGRFLRGEPITARPISRPARLWRWCRRKPVVATLTASLLLTLMAVTATSSFAYVRELAHRHEIEDKNTVIGQALEGEKKSKVDATQRLYRSLVAQARANRLSRRIGQRFESLEVLREASRMAHAMSLPEADFLELRNEAIACLTLADLRTAQEWNGWPTGSLQVSFDSALERYARIDRSGNVSVRRVSDDAELWSLTGLGSLEAWPTLSPDGRFLAVANNRFKLWDLSAHEPILSEGNGYVSAFRPDSRQMALLQENSQVRLFDLPAVKQVREIAVASPVRCVAYHPQLARLAVSSPTGVQILEIDTGAVLTHLPQPGAGNLAWHPDGKMLAVVGSDYNIHCWVVATGKVSAELKGHAAGTNLAFSNTGDCLASTGWFQPLRLWNPQTGDQLFQSPIAMTQFPRFSPDDRLAVCFAGDGRLRILEVVTAQSCFRTMIRDPALGRGIYCSSDVSPNGRLLAAGMADGVALWDLASGKPLTFLPTGNVTRSVRFEPSGALLASGHMGLVRWPIEVAAAPVRGSVRIGSQEELLPDEPSECLGISRDGRVVAQAMFWGGMVWNRDSANPPHRLMHDDTRYIDVSPDGRWVATGSHSQTKVRIWDASTGTLAHELPTEGLAYVVFSADGRWLVTGADGNRLWSVDSWKEARSIGGRGGVAFSPDAKVLAVENGNGAIRLINPETGRDYASLENPHQARSVHARFSADGSQLTVTATEGQAIHVWNLREIREQLAEMGLDWDLPPYPPAEALQPLTLEIAKTSVPPPSPSPLEPNNLQRLIDLLQVRDERAVAAAKQLGELGAQAVPAIPALNAAMNNRANDSLQWTLQSAAADALGRIGPAAVPVLIKAASSSDDSLRTLAHKALALMEQRPVEVVQAIRELLNNTEPAVRRAAVLSLRRLGGESAVLDELQAKLKDDNPGVRHAAAYVLGEIGTPAEAAIPDLIVALRDEQASVARAATTALGLVGAKSDDVIRVLIAIASDGNQSQRCSVLAALGQIGPAASAALPIVQSALSGNDLGLRIVARQTLRRIDAQLAEKQLGPPYDPVAASQQDRATLRVGPHDWPQWGGSRLRNNTPDGKNIPMEWDIKTGRNIKWASKLGSQTYGNPVVANGKVYIGTNNNHGYLKRYPAKVDLGVLLCFEEATGKFLWQYSSPKLPSGRVNDWHQIGMPSTPVIDGNRLWAVTNRCEVVCLDTEGFRDGENDGPFCNEANENPDEADVVWRFDMMKELGVFPHNMSQCSMAMADGVLFVCTSNGIDDNHLTLPAPDAPSFMAMDRDTGKVLWTDNSPGRNILHAQWASPAYGVFNGQAQVIFPGGDGWLYSFDPKGNGQGGSRLLWKFDTNPKESIYLLGGRSTRNQIIAFPAIYDGLVFIAVGEDPEHGEGVGHLWCLDPAHRINGADVSEVLAVDAASNLIPHRRLQAVNVKLGEGTVPNPDSAVCWHYTSQDRNANGKIEFEEQFHRSMSTPVIKDDILYVADMSGLFHCLNAKTGDAYWTHDQFAATWGSALLVDGKVYVGDEDGDVTMFNHSADPAIALPNGAPLAEPNMVNSIYSTPIVANNVLYIATKNMLYAIQDYPERSPPGTDVPDATNPSNRQRVSDYE